MSCFNWSPNCRSELQLIAQITMPTPAIAALTPPKADWTSSATAVSPI